MIEHEIMAFGRRLGFERLELDGQGRVQLDISGLGSFSLEMEEGKPSRTLLMHLRAPVDTHDPSHIRKLLMRCNYRHNPPFPLSAGVFRGNAIVMSRMPEDSVTASGIENTLRFLADCLQTS